MVTRAEIVAKAREAMDTKWVHQGRVVPHGIDCVGLGLWTVWQLGLPVKDADEPYPKNAQWEKFIQYFRREMDEISINDMLPGDVPIFRQHIYPCHCGIMTKIGDDPFFIHAYALRRRVVEERYTADWRAVTRTAFRFRGVTD